MYCTTIYSSEGNEKIYLFDGLNKHIRIPFNESF